MNRFKVSSAYKYYNYLTKYDTEFIRKYQAGTGYYLGQKSLWRNLIYKYGADHINLEEEHNVKYKTHWAFVAFSYRFTAFLFFYLIVYTGTYLGEQGRAYNVKDADYLTAPPSDNDFPTRYERFYAIDRPQKY